MSAKHFETVSQQLHHNFIIGFIIIHHNYLIGFVIGFIIITHRAAEFFFANWDSGRNEQLRDYVQSPSWIRRHKFELGHIDKLHMLRIRVQYWGARLEPVDLHLPCARLNREIPPSASSPKKANRENRHISSIVHDVFYARFEFWVPKPCHVS